jgi:hypothetical protein
MVRGRDPEAILAERPRLDRGALDPQEPAAPLSHGSRLAIVQARSLSTSLGELPTRRRTDAPYRTRTTCVDLSEAQLDEDPGYRRLQLAEPAREPLHRAWG